MTSTIEFFGPSISTYTRQEAIADGVLIDLNAIAPEECKLYRYKIACTAAVWNLIQLAVESDRYPNDLKGVVWDILWMSQKASSRQYLDDSTILFPVIIQGIAAQAKPDFRESKMPFYRFKLVCGPGDHKEAVLTLMLPTED